MKHDFKVLYQMWSRNTILLIEVYKYVVYSDVYLFNSVSSGKWKNPDTSTRVEGALGCHGERSLVSSAFLIVKNRLPCYTRVFKVHEGKKIIL